MTQPNDPRHPNDPVLDDYAKAQKDEYETYIAADTIWIGTARGWNAGDPVPKSTAERLGWDKDAIVLKRNSTDGRKRLKELGLLSEPEETTTTGKKGGAS